MLRVDWAIIAAYLFVVIAMSAWAGRRQEDEVDYYVGGRRLPWWAIGVSTIATQTSVISFVSIPGFVAAREGGGLNWLQFALGLPLAMIAVCALLLPFFRGLGLVSIYEYLEARFGLAPRLALSAIFLISRGLATGVTVYASAVILEVCLGIDLWATILLVGVATVVYDALGGMAAVVYSDVLQMAVLLAGVVACIWLGLEAVGGWTQAVSLLAPERWRAHEPGWGVGESAEGVAPFWAVLIGGFVISVSYFGTEQSQAQRALSAPDEAGTRRAVALAGLVHFPLTLLYVGVGIALGALVASDPEFAASVGAPDSLVPRFVVDRLPAGWRALLLAAMLAAAMSSLDSALNSMSAATMRDFVDRAVELSDRERLLGGKLITILWGTAITASAFLFGGEETAVELINKVGSAFYGPVLGAFLCGILSRRVSGAATLIGVVAGVSASLALWLLEAPLHWIWWNVVGLGTTALIAIGLSAAGVGRAPDDLEGLTLSWRAIARRERSWWPLYVGLLCYFALIVAVVFGIDALAPSAPTG